MTLKQKKYWHKFNNKPENKCHPAFTHVHVNINSAFVMSHYEEMRKHKLYSLMKTIPKGALHHCHIDCCEDK